MLLRILLVISGLALGLGTALLFQPTEPRSDTLHFATLMVKARNEAILAKDWEALFALSVPGTAARDADIALVEWIEEQDIDVQSLHTEVNAATELNEDELRGGLAKADVDASGHGTAVRIVEVRSVQMDIDVASAVHADEPIERCAIWILEGSRMQDVRECLE